MKIAKEIKIAIVTIISIVIIYVGIIFLKGLKLFNNDVSYFVEITDVQGMPTASDVRANGLKVGKVKDIVFDPKTQLITVEINVSPEFQIPEGTSVYMTKEMLGAAMMNLKLGSDPTKTLTPGDTIKGTPMLDLMTAAGEMVPQVQAMLPKMDSILTAFNTLANDPALGNSLHNMEAVSNDLKTTTTRLNGLLGKDVPQLMARTNAICANLEATTNDIRKIDIPGMASKADATLTNLHDMSFKFTNVMNSKDNTLGYLMNDNTIALRVDSTLTGASMLLDDIRLHPTRYVNVSLFGKKEKTAKK